MAFFFGRSRQKSSLDLPRVAKELLPKIDVLPPQKLDEVTRLLGQMKYILQGTQETDSSPDQVYQLVVTIVQEDFLLALARVIHKLPFESRKDAQVIFSSVLRFKPGGAASASNANAAATDPMALSYLIHHRPETITTLCRGYDRRESALPCGTILREILKHEAVTATILYDEPDAALRPAANKVVPAMHPDRPQSGQGVFWKFFEWIDQGSFEVSADAFTTFREILTKHKVLIAHYLDLNFDLFFAKYNSILVQSENYVTKRQSIKLLGETLLDRANYQVMTAYVDRGENLKLCMNLLKDERKMVQYEGFHIFKIFVANPHKSPGVQRILWNNKDRLSKFLHTFLDDRTDDEQFLDEKTFLINQIDGMTGAPPAPAGTGTGTGTGVGTDSAGYGAGAGAGHGRRNGSIVSAAAVPC